MKLKKTLFILSFLVFASHTFASSVDIACPPVSVVKANANFTRTQPTILPTLKQIFTNEYQYENRGWTTMFIFRMDITKADDTLNYGQALFNNANLSEHAETKKDHGSLTCTYQTDKGVLVETYTRLS